MYLRRYKGPSAATRDRCVGAYFGIVPRYSNIDETDVCTAKVRLRRRTACQYGQYLHSLRSDARRARCTARWRARPRSACGGCASTRTSTPPTRYSTYSTCSTVHAVQYNEVQYTSYQVQYDPANIVTYVGKEQTIISFDFEAEVG